MSLINDALKKAQKQRTGDVPPLASMPAIGGESAARIAKRGKPAGFNTLVLRLGLGAGALLAVIAIGGYFALRKKPETGNLKPEGSETNSGLRSQVSSLATTPQVSGLKSQVSEPPAPAPAFNLPIAAPVPAEPLPTVAQHLPDDGQDKSRAGSSQQRETVGQTPGGQQPATASHQTPIVASKPAPSAATPQVSGLKSQVSLPGDGPGQTPGGQQLATVPLKMDNKAITFIENLRIAGIRASATDAKVLMNDRVYRVGDMVERELGLKLTGITASSLAFEDEKGARYTRSF